MALSCMVAFPLTVLDRRESSRAHCACRPTAPASTRNCEPGRGYPTQSQAIAAPAPRSAGAGPAAVQLLRLCLEKERKTLSACATAKLLGGRFAACAPIVAAPQLAARGRKPRRTH